MKSRTKELVIWAVAVAGAFATAGYVGLAITDAVLKPHPSMKFTSNGLLLAWVCLPPAVIGACAFYGWAGLGWRLLKGWPSVAAAACLSLVLNPVSVFTVMVSLFVFGFLVLGCITVAAMVLSGLWHLTNAPGRLRIS